ncbi:MAG: CDP-diacylglycerol--glycerol-3-phosphate 3-phosphatidyltransferase [Clostridia bacterium]|nr:CDP-diacylglycerol--glycerol-3-phosphate 3-phosphatidyltransferase [Clostridia bacterium]
MNLPNKITLARMILVPFMLIVPLFGITSTILGGITVENIIILAIFLIASITDFLDGHLARKNNMVTTFGKFLDPIADKLLVITALMMLVESGIIPAWIPIITVAREFLVSGVRMLAAGEGTVIAASMLGKIKTVSQMVAISLAFVSINPFMDFIGGELQGLHLIINILMSIAMVVSVIATIWSGTDYLVKSKNVILKSK